MVHVKWCKMPLIIRTMNTFAPGSRATQDPDILQNYILRPLVQTASRKGYTVFDTIHLTQEADYLAVILL